MSMKEFEEQMKQQRKLRDEIISFLKERDLTYKETLAALKDAISHLEMASLKNKI